MDAVQQPSPQQHIQERIVKQEVDIPVPLIVEGFVAVVHQERGQERTAVQRGNIPVRPMMEEIAAVVQEVKLVQRPVEHVPAPTVEVVRLVA